MAEAEDFQRFIEFLTENRGREAHVEIGQRASDIPDYDDVIATLDGPLGPPRMSPHPERGDLVGFAAVGEEIQGRRQVTEHAGVAEALFDDFYIAVAPH